METWRDVTNAPETGNSVQIQPHAVSTWQLSFEFLSKQYFFPLSPKGPASVTNFSLVLLAHQQHRTIPGAGSRLVAVASAK